MHQITKKTIPLNQTHFTPTHTDQDSQLWALISALTKFIYINQVPEVQNLNVC